MHPTAAAPACAAAPHLCDLLWDRGIALYPDLPAGEGVALVCPPGADCADLRAPLAAARDAAYRFLCDSLTPLDACELAAFYGFGEGAIASMLRRLVRRRGLPPAGWDDAQIARMAAHAIDQADRYPEEWIRLGLRRGARAPIVPFDEEIAASIFQAGGEWADAQAALARRRDASGLPAGDQELEDRTQGGYWLLYADMGALSYRQHRMRLLRRTGR